MYLNEKSWAVLQEDSRSIDVAMRKFLALYACIKKKYPRSEIYIDKDEVLYFRTKKYTIDKWLNDTDKEYKRLYLAFWNQRKVYTPDDESEFIFNKESLKGCLEAYLNNSFVLSIGFDDTWKIENIQGIFYSLLNNKSEEKNVKNMFSKEQLNDDSIIEALENENSIKILSYEYLWEKRHEFFPHLYFVPDVYDNLKQIGMSSSKQIIKKLNELEKYCIERAGERFDQKFLSKATTESQETLKRYESEHTFIDCEGNKHIANWHLRFTGEIAGRVFFVPNYKNGNMLICYIGKKLPTVKYHS